MGRATPLALGLLLTLGTGCSGVIARRLVRAPNGGSPVRGEPFSVLQGVHPTLLPFRIQDGVGLDLEARQVEPGSWGFDYQLAESPTGFKTTFRLRPPESLATAPRGTVLMLHGYGLSKESLVPWAIRFAQAGYRSLLVDLPGHGGSRGAQVTFGARERDVLRRALDRLQGQDRLAGPLALFGVSLGGSLSLRLAAGEPRVRTVVALEPFWDGREAVRGFLRESVESSRWGRWITESQQASALRKAPALAGFRWEETALEPDLQRIAVPVLLIHGEADDHIPLVHSERILSRLPQGSRLTRVPGAHHFNLPARLDPLAPRVLEWLDQHLPRH